MPGKATIIVNINGLPVASSISDVSSHPPIIGELSTDSTTQAATNGVIKGTTALSQLPVPQHFNTHASCPTQAMQPHLHREAYVTVTYAVW
jgi:hypothetical protein